MKISNLMSTIIGVAIVMILVGATVLKVNNEHNEKLLLVSEKKISEAAEKCILEEKCNEDEITLGSLIEKEYLEKQIHPLTKEYIDETTKVTCKNEKCKTNID